MYVICYRDTRESENELENRLTEAKLANDALNTLNNTLTSNPLSLSLSLSLSVSVSVCVCVSGL